MNYGLIVEAVDVQNPVSHRAFESHGYKNLSVVPFLFSGLYADTGLNQSPVGFFYSIIGKPEHDGGDAKSRETPRDLTAPTGL